jgi:hypothetical protein
MITANQSLAEVPIVWVTWSFLLGEQQIWELEISARSSMGNRRSTEGQRCVGDEMSLEMRAECSDALVEKQVSRWQSRAQREDLWESSVARW